jgi:hypothetical protein
MSTCHCPDCLDRAELTRLRKMQVRVEAIRDGLPTSRLNQLATVRSRLDAALSGGEPHNHDAIGVYGGCPGCGTVYSSGGAA